MTARQELERLKKEFVSLESEEQRENFDVKFCNHIASKSEVEKEEFANAFVESAKDAVEQARKVCDYVDSKMKYDGIGMQIKETALSAS
ncbi:hypothetical protein AGMMS49574_11160 [Bacteroidia bacterium]|nr:hypothetical protein AGMMS49574_11160 [Bacteroidia bacterium]